MIMRLHILTSIAGVVTASAGRVLDVEGGLADKLIKLGYAEEVKERDSHGNKRDKARRREESSED